MAYLSTIADIKLDHVRVTLPPESHYANIRVGFADGYISLSVDEAKQLQAALATAITEGERIDSDPTALDLPMEG